MLLRGTLPALVTSKVNSMSSPWWTVSGPSFSTLMAQERTSTGTGEMKSCSCESIDVELRVCICTWPKLKQGLLNEAWKSPVRLIVASPQVPSSILLSLFSTAPGR